MYMCGIEYLDSPMDCVYFVSEFTLINRVITINVVYIYKYIYIYIYIYI